MCPSMAFEVILYFMKNLRLKYKDQILIKNISKKNGFINIKIRMTEFNYMATTTLLEIKR